jgi:hypothetical protein
MRSLDFSIGLILPAALWPSGRSMENGRNLPRKWIDISRNFSGFPTYRPKPRAFKCISSVSGLLDLPLSNWFRRMDCVRDSSVSFMESIGSRRNPHRRFPLMQYKGLKPEPESEQLRPSKYDTRSRSSAD